MGEYRPKSREEIARNMAAIRSKDNRTEKALRTALHRIGLRYRKYARGLPGKPDIAFISAKLAIFVDGDYWHGRVVREQGLGYFAEKLKTGNREYWLAKMERNIRRDDDVTLALEKHGWMVLRYWESDVRKAMDDIVLQIAAAVAARRK